MKTRFMKLVTVMAMILSFIGFSFAQLTLTPSLTDNGTSVTMTYNEDWGAYVADDVPPTAILTVVCSEASAKIEVDLLGAEDFQEYTDPISLSQAFSFSSMLMVTVKATLGEQSTSIMIKLTKKEVEMPLSLFSMLYTEDGPVAWTKSGNIGEEYLTIFAQDPNVDPADYAGDGSGVFTATIEDGCELQLTPTYLGESEPAIYVTTNGDEPTEESSDYYSAVVSAGMPLNFETGKTELVVKALLVIKEAGKAPQTVSQTYTFTKVGEPVEPAGPDTVTVSLMDMQTFSSITSWTIGSLSPAIDASMKNVGASTLRIGDQENEVAVLVILSKDEVKDSSIANNFMYFSNTLKTAKLTAGDWAISYVLVKGNSTLAAPVVLEEGKAVVSKASIFKLTVEELTDDIPEDDPSAPAITFAPASTGGAVDNGTEITLTYDATELKSVVFKTFATIQEAKAEAPGYMWESYSENTKPMVTAAQPVLVIGGTKSDLPFSFEYKYYRVYEVNPLTSVATPTFEMQTDDEPEVVSGEVQLSEDGATILIRCATAGATIRYTTDGTDITDAESGLAYPGFVEINSACTLKAKAFAGTISSEQASIKFTTKTTEPETFALRPIVKNGDNVVDLMVLPADEANYRIYAATDVKKENLTITLQCSQAGDATITYALRRIDKEDNTKNLNLTYSDPIEVTEDMWGSESFEMTAAVKLGDKTDTIRVRLVPEYNQGPSELIIMAGLTQNGATLRNWVKNGNKTAAEMGDWAQACMLGGDGTGIYAYDEIPRNTRLVLGLIDGTFTGKLYYTLDGTEADAENGTEYDLTSEGGMPLTFPAGKDTLVVKAAAFTTSDDYAAATFTFTQGNWADIPVFVRKNGTEADTVIVLKGESDSLFVATGRDSISAVAAGFAKFLKNDTIAVNKDTVIVAYTKFGKFLSDTVKYEYKKTVTPEPDTVKAPTFSVAAGEVPAGTKVELKSATTGAKIYYTVNGAEPTTASTEYTDSIVIDKAMTIKAIAVKEGMVNSKISSAAYTIKAVVVEVAKPTFNPAAGAVVAGTKVEIKCTTTGSKIYYTTDGTTPTDKSTEYKEAITIDKAMTIKAIAYVGEDKSEVVEAAYTLKPVGNEGKELAGVSVYPNPNDGEFYVTVPVNATVEVYAANGQRVSAKAAVAGKNLVKVNNAGIYFVRVRANGQDAIRKVVVR